ncbi:MAG TPA: PKD domain-containing protein, partial [Thermoplasmatales archaeon]|nr:PKD domain-containing protein [Thermoplasmatales archaeon]
YITNWTWDFGDGTFGYGEIVEHLYLSSGEYTIALTVTDDENASSSYSKTILIDIIPPDTIKTVGTPKYGSNDEWVTSHTEFNLTATDDFSGVNKTYYRIWHNDAWSDWIEYHGNFTLTGEGRHCLEYYSVDNAGNIEEVHNQTHFVDDISPVTTIEFGTPYYTDNTEKWITTSTLIYLNATDYPECACGVETTYYCVDGGDWHEYTEPFTIDEECQHTIEYYSIDYLGNEEEHHIITVYVDNTPPVTTIEFGTPYYTNGTDEWITSWTTIYLNATDYPSCASSGVKEIWYSYDNGTTWHSTTGNNATFTIPDECKRIIKWYAVDNLGNTEEIHSIEVKVDDTPPVTLLEESEPYYIDDRGIWVTSDTMLYLNATDYPSCGCGVNSSWYKIDDGSWNLYPGRIVILEEGEHTLYYYSVDNLGNSEVIKNQTIYVDDTPPTTLIDVEYGDTYYTYDPETGRMVEHREIRSVKLTADDSNGVDHCMVYWATRDPFGRLIWHSQPDSVTFKGDAAKEVVEFYSVDALGNQESVRRADWATPIH